MQRSTVSERPLRSRALSPFDLRRALRGACLAGSVALAGLASTAVQSADADTETAGGATLQEVVVTGSLIKRSDTETPSPVQVVTAQDLQQSGYTSVSEVLRQLASNGQGTLTQSFTQAFAGGGAGVALRGLTVGATLTLIDGERMVGYPLTDDGERNFVDVSQIPFNAVERIEVLKDGASAIYGSDAIAGVVNVILKKSFTGVEFTAEAGTSEKNDGTTEHFAGIAGVGDLDNDGYNAYLTFELRHQDRILVASRAGEGFTTLDFTSLGGLNTTPGRFDNPTVPFPGSVTGYLLNPTAGGAPAFLPGCTAAQANANQCTYSQNGLELQPATKNINILGRFTKTLPADWTATVTASLFHSQAEQVGPSYFFTNGFPAFNVAIGPSTPPTVIPNPPTFITVPSTYPGNPFGAPATLVYNFHELGQFNQQFNTDTYRLFADLKGTVLGWDVGASAGIMYAALGNSIIGGQANLAQLQAALNAPVPYLVGANPVGNAAAFSQPSSTTDTSSLALVDLHAQHKVIDLPGGAATILGGFQYNRRNLNSLAPPSVASGAQNGNNAFAIGTQDDYAFFAETDLPIFKGFEADAAIRYDHYTTFGGSSTPKFGVKYTPFDMLTVRATYAQGFRAPSIAEAGNSGLAFLAATIPDPTLCPNPAAPTTGIGNFPSQCAVQLLGVQNSNQNLLPERSSSYTVGFILQPIQQFSVSADYYNININRDIISSFELGGLAALAGTPIAGNAFIRGPQIVLPQVTGPGGATTNTLTPVGTILFQPFPYVNASTDKTDGIDVEFKGHLDLNDYGRLSTDINYTHIIDWNLTGFGVTYHLAGTHGPQGISGDTGNPRDRFVASVSWDKGAFDLTATTNYTGSFLNIDPSAGQPTCVSALNAAFSSEYGSRYLLGAGAPFAQSLCKVKSFTDEDVYVSYQVSRHLQVHGSVLNVFNAQPPFDATTYGGGGAASYDAALHQAGAVGRFFNIGATFQF
jgi:iron complex outermembrane receptor protein